jgi:hypothetical protein
MPTEKTASKRKQGEEPLEEPSRDLVRPEARPLGWERLTRDQQRVLVDIHEWLIEFIRKPIPRHPRPGRRGPFEYQEILEHRPSNVILIDGGRGSGKTSILITLLRMWRRIASGEKLQEGSPEEGARGSQGAPGPEQSGTRRRSGASAVTSKTRADSRWQRVLRQLNGPLFGRLIPVRALDLQPLPPSTSLLPWVAARIMELVDHLEDPSGKPASRESSEPIASWKPDWERELPSRRAWKRLMQCAALGWNSNLPDRRGTLDPDSYAVELNQAERARLSMVDAWREFIEAVIADAHRLFPGQLHEDARLIIPIDDADMNPHRCVELLELMRSLWSPQVVFVLTGHSKLFLKTLQIHQLKVLRQPLGSTALLPAELGYLEAEPHPRALALQVYDKAIPAPHRFVLSPLGGSERLKRLKRLLKRPVQKERDDQRLPPAVLAGYFELSPVLQEGLPHRLRRLLNIRQELKQCNRAGELVLQLWRDAITNGEWTQEEQRALKQFVQLDSQGELRVIVRNQFKPEVERLVQILQPTGDSLHVNVVTSYSFEVPQLLPGGQPITLPLYLSALLLLATNVAADETAGRFPQAYPAPSGADYPLAISHIPHPALRSLDLAFHWPIPGWVAPVDFALFDETWAEYLVALNDASVSPDEWKHSLLNLYLAGLFDVGMGRKFSLFKTGGAEKPSPASVADWKSAVGEIVKRAHEGEAEPREKFNTLRERAFRRWLLSEAILIAAPEYGLPASIANELLQTWQEEARKYEGFERHVFQAAQQVRRQRAETVLREARLRDEEIDPDKLLRDIDSLWPEFQWSATIEGRPGPKLALLPRLTQTLEQIRVQHAPSSSARDPHTLDGYLSTLGVKHLLPTSDEKEFASLESRLRRFTSAQGVAQLALVELWRYVLSNEPGGPHNGPWSLTPKAAGIEVRMPKQMWDHFKNPTSRRHGVETDIPLGNGRVLRLFTASDRPESPPAALQGLLQVAHDVREDESDLLDRNPGTTLKTLQKLASTLLPHAATIVRLGHWNVEIGWPVPRWTTFLDWKLMDEVWLQIFKSISQLRSEENEALMQSSLGAIIHSLIAGILSICTYRSTMVPPLDFKVGPDAFSHDGIALHSLATLSNQQGRRFDRIKEWASTTAVLLAAPETGLPAPLARGLLQLLQPEGVPVDLGRLHSSFQPEYRPLIRELRRKRIQLAMRKPDQPSAVAYESARHFLADLDGTTDPHHPWFQVFGKDFEGTQSA